MLGGPEHPLASYIADDISIRKPLVDIINNCVIIRGYIYFDHNADTAMATYGFGLSIVRISGDDGEIGKVLVGALQQAIKKYS
jgi:hypothetical protein